MVYLLHFSQPYKHARHYLGFCDDQGLEKRIKRHRKGDGAHLIKVIMQAGIDFAVVRTWPGTDRTFERKLKNSGHSKRFCPLCCRTSCSKQGE